VTRVENQIQIDAARAVAEVSTTELGDALGRGRPFVIRSEARLLHAASFYNLETLRAVGGGKIIQVEHMHRWNGARLTTTLAQFIADIDESEFYWRQAGTNSLGLAAPDLPVPVGARSDMRFFDYLWVGPRGTIQTFHQDHRDEIVVNENMFCQLVGSKYAALADPSDSDYFTSRPLTPKTRRHSAASPFDPRTRRCCATFQETMLHGGDLLYVPRRYWHYMESLSVSLSISRWWFPARVVEILYSAATRSGAEVHRPGRASWEADAAEVGGEELLYDYIRKLPDNQRYAILAALERSYGRGVFDGRTDRNPDHL
jgi:hypothetical protein